VLIAQSYNLKKPWVWSIDLAFSHGRDPVHGFGPRERLQCRRPREAGSARTNRESPVAD